MRKLQTKSKGGKMEREKPQKEFIRASLFKDYETFNRLIREAQLEEQFGVSRVPEDPQSEDSQIYGAVRAWDFDHYKRYLEAVRTFLRKRALKKEECLSVWPGRGGAITHLFSLDKIVVCRDSKNEIIYEGEITNCTSPVYYFADDLLSRAGRGDDWHEVCFWDLGGIEELGKSHTLTGCLLLKEPGVFLFTDELSRLTKGEFVTVQKHQPWCGFSSIIFEGYHQNINGDVFRVWANFTD